MKKAKITVIGSFIVDLTAFTPKFPVEGETAIGAEMRIGAGGKGSNQATAAHRGGAEVTLITKTGTDSLCTIATDHYAAEGMRTDYVYSCEAYATGAALIEVSTATGENRIIVITGANDAITRGEVFAAEAEIAASDIVLMQLETSQESIAAGLELAKKYNVKTVLNPAPAKEFPAELFPLVDYFTPNETEAAFFSGIPVKTTDDAVRAAEILLTRGVKNVIITMGRQGAVYVGERGCLIVPTTDLRAVDTTGAGDAFNGGFCVALGEGRDIEYALKFANSTASISVTRPGTSPSMPCRDEIDSLMKDFYKL